MTKDLYKYFLIESDELIENLSRDILEFEKKQDDPDLLNRLFRYAHTLKGAAHVVGLLNITKLAHSIEDLFSGARDQGVLLTTEKISLILDTVDLIRLIIEAIKEGRPDDSIDSTAILKRFSENESGNVTTAADNLTVPNRINEQSETAPASMQTGTEKAESDTKNNKKNSNQKETPESDLIYEPQSSPAGPTNTETIRASISDVDDLMDMASELITGAIRLEELHSCLKNATRKCGRITTDYLKLKDFINRQSHPKNKDENFSLKYNALLKKIDLETLHIQLLKHTSSLDTTIEELKQISDSAYRIIHKTRSIKVSEVSHYFKGIVRSLSVKLDKKLRLVITGDEIKLDRNLIEELKEPVNQIIRNAAVHGIEDERERLQKEKNAEGLIRIDFKKAGNSVHVICEDDGQGINLGKVKEIAVKKGIIDEKKARELSRKDSLCLIFATGFTSGKLITEFAGRGVGLDIVKDRIESLRGTVECDSEEDKFTRFSIKLPLSLNMIDAFLIETSGRKYLIPLNMIEKTGYLSYDELEYSTGQSIIKLNEMPVTLLWLTEALNLGPRRNEGRSIPFVLLKYGHKTAAIAVDELSGVRKIILKNLGEQLKDINFFTGGAILSNGMPALVLNVANLFEYSANNAGRSDTFTTDSETEDHPIPHILAVDDSLTTRVLISGVLESEGYNVTLAASGEEALEIMDNNNYNLFILDVEMPGINGFELASRIRKNPEHKETPIVILSSLSKDEHRRKGIEVGAQAYIVKGRFDQGIFLETVKRLV